MKVQGGDYCDHCEIEKGCSIYEQRPFCCQAYRCLWVCGKGEESDRPDLLEMVMDIKGIEFQSEEVVALNFWEVEEGAINTPRVQSTMVVNLEAGNVVVYRPYQEAPIYYFPKGKFTEEEQHMLIDAMENDPGPLLRDLLGD